MKTKIFVGIIILLSVLIINACENKQAVAPLILSPCAEDTLRVTYSSDSNTMQAIINVQCGVNNSSCHPAGGGASGYDYSTYAGIDANYKSGLLYSALFGNGSSVPKMPLSPTSTWDQCTLTKFKAWIDQGCPQ